MIKLEVNEGYIDATIKGNPVMVATELVSAVRAVNEFLEESAGKELGNHLARRSCEIAFMTREELKAESEESEKKMAEAFRKIMEELF